jgi:hypothetical protein
MIQETRPSVTHINEVGGVVAGALPLLYEMAEQIVRSTAGKPATSSATDADRTPGTRRSRHHDGVGFIPPG